MTKKSVIYSVCKSYRSAFLLLIWVVGCVSLATVVTEKTVPSSRHDVNDRLSDPKLRLSVTGAPEPEMRRLVMSAASDTLHSRIDNDIRITWRGELREGDTVRFEAVFPCHKITGPEAMTRGEDFMYDQDRDGDLDMADYMAYQTVTGGA